MSVASFCRNLSLSLCCLFLGSLAACNADPPTGASIQGVDQKQLSETESDIDEDYPTGEQLGQIPTESLPFELLPEAEANLDQHTEEETSIAYRHSIARILHLSLPKKVREWRRNISSMRLLTSEGSLSGSSFRARVTVSVLPKVTQNRVAYIENYNLSNSRGRLTIVDETGRVIRRIENVVNFEMNANRIVYITTTGRRSNPGTLHILDSNAQPIPNYQPIYGVFPHSLSVSRDRIGYIVHFDYALEMGDLKIIDLNGVPPTGISTFESVYARWFYADSRRIILSHFYDYDHSTGDMEVLDPTGHLYPGFERAIMYVYMGPGTEPLVSANQLGYFTDVGLRRDGKPLGTLNIITHTGTPNVGLYTLRDVYVDSGVQFTDFHVAYVDNLQEHRLRHDQSILKGTLQIRRFTGEFEPNYVPLQNVPAENGFQINREF